MDIQGIIDLFLSEERSLAVLLPDTQVQALAVSAVGFYCGYNDLKSVPNTELEDIHLGAKISIAEWAVIKPLFLLYVERETALQVEATGMQGVSGYGRGSAEVNADIARLEEAFSTLASCFGIITVGGDDSIDATSKTSTFPYGFNYPIY